VHLPEVSGAIRNRRCFSGSEDAAAKLGRCYGVLRTGMDIVGPVRVDALPCLSTMISSADMAGAVARCGVM